MIELTVLACYGAKSDGVYANGERQGIDPGFVVRVVPAKGNCTELQLRDGTELFVAEPYTVVMSMFSEGE